MLEDIPDEVLVYEKEIVFSYNFNFISRLCKEGDI
jgi:hypothetical protein